MQLRIKCPGCQTVVAVPDEHAEKTTRCPRCKTILTHSLKEPVSASDAISAQIHPPVAPLIEPLDVLPVEPDAGQKPSGHRVYSRRAETKPRAWTFAHGLIVGGAVAGVLLLGCVGLGSVAYIMYRTPSADKSKHLPAASSAISTPPRHEDPAPEVAQKVEQPAPLDGDRQRVSGPVQWKAADGGNNHFYEFVPDNISWTQAKRAAEARTFKGVRGHLTTITSAEEKEFLRTALPAHKAWLGGYQDTQAPDYAEPGGGWRWITGEEWKYTNWSSMSPDEFNPGQNYLVLDPGAPPYDGTRWDDAEDNYSVAGYYVEYPMPP